MKQNSIIFLFAVLVTVNVLFAKASKRVQEQSESLTKIRTAEESVLKRMARSYREYSPNDRGYMNFYVRKSCRDSDKTGYQQTAFPYVRFSPNRFPTMSTWVRVSRWMPIYVDRLSKQTIVLSQYGTYVFPPLVNAYGRLFPVAELLISGYATLLTNGVPMPNVFDINLYAQQNPYYMRNFPSYNTRTGTFADGIRTDYRWNFSEDCEDDDSDSDDPYPKDVYYSTRRKFTSTIRPKLTASTTTEPEATTDFNDPGLTTAESGIEG